VRDVIAEKHGVCVNSAQIRRRVEEEIGQQWKASSAKMEGQG
jgi:hypothetical protein